MPDIFQIASHCFLVIYQRIGGSGNSEILGACLFIDDIPPHRAELLGLLAKPPCIGLMIYGHSLSAPNQTPRWLPLAKNRRWRVGFCCTCVRSNDFRHARIAPILLKANFNHCAGRQRYITSSFKDGDV